MTAPKVCLVLDVVEAHTIADLIDDELMRPAKDPARVVRLGALHQRIYDLLANVGDPNAQPRPLGPGECHVWLVTLEGQGERDMVELLVARVAGPRRIDALGRFRAANQKRIDQEEKSRGRVRLVAEPAEGEVP